jgi:hypothetical protein
VTDGVVIDAYEGCPIPRGVRVRFSYLVWRAFEDPGNVTSSNRLSEYDVFINQSSIIYWYDGKYHCLFDQILAEPIYEDENDIKTGSLFVKSELGTKNQVAKVRAVGPDVECGVGVGDVVFHTLKQRVKVEIYGSTEWWDLLRDHNIMGLCDPMSDEEVARRLQNRNKFAEEVNKLRPDTKGIVINTDTDEEREFQRVNQTRTRKIFT